MNHSWWPPTRPEGTGKTETYSQKKKPQVNEDLEQVTRTPHRRALTKGPENKEKEKSSSGTKAQQQKAKKQNCGKD